MVEKYGTADKFMTVFNPDLQQLCAANLERSFMGDAPTLATLRQTYTENQVLGWIFIQMENLNDFAGVKEKVSEHQMLSLAGIILTEYYYLKASELLLFFFKLKAGTYGHFYSSVDPMVITVALQEFKQYRRQQIDMYEREQERERKEQERIKRIENARPCPEHLGIAKLFVKSTQSGDYKEFHDEMKQQQIKELEKKLNDLKK